MNLRAFLIAALVLLLQPYGILSAGDTTQKDELSTDVETQIKQLFGNNPRLKLTRFNDRLYEISIDAKSYFASADGRYIFAGPILDTKTGQNITELRAQNYRKERISNLDETMYLSFESSTPQQKVVTLFTDIDCTFCRQFHQHMDAFNAEGITINYVMLPRAGINSTSFEKTVAVLCSNDPQKNMTLAMKNQFFGSAQCATSLPKQLKLAQELGISSTPTMILPDGQIRLGLTTPGKLRTLLDSIQ
ncbi:DsbC family protein [Aliikangiella coralliicola]|uniref:Thiol:disulfide interchange protein n=1 Tax=Aliikangiella coralliicola TaxID=2592383 RepID=A0A545UJ65_9GAMM|nr:DsbC family protein [Aliikangiella coralliicola]TQV89514.1 DsbC family protein [Aliikangiella coralliicola]